MGHKPVNMDSRAVPTNNFRPKALNYRALQVASVRLARLTGAVYGFYNMDLSHTFPLVIRSWV